MPSVLMCKVNTKCSIEQGKNLFSDRPDFFETKKSVEVSFTAPDLSSLGGLVLVSNAEKTCGIIGAFSRCVVDWRNPLQIRHSIKEMVSQRVMQIACGYEDADDCDTLRADSMVKMSCGREGDGRDLCSQPTMTRLENHLEHKELYDIGEAFVDNFIKSYAEDKGQDRVRARPSRKMPDKARSTPSLLETPQSTTPSLT